MVSYLDNLLSLVRTKNERHAKALARNPHFDDADFRNWAESFLQRYEVFLKKKELSWEQVSDFYMKVVSDTIGQQFHFKRTGEYSCKSFQDAYENVYSKPEVMEYYMNGLLLTQVLWPHHYEVFQFFRKTMQDRVGSVQRYLEIGGGHGAYVAEATSIFEPPCHIQVVDVSPTSLEMARLLVDSPRVEFTLKNVYEYQVEEKFDQVVMGEVLEHVETPEELLQALGELTAEQGRLFLTTPMNAPAIDHISLFRSPQELREIFREGGGWQVESELVLPAEGLSLEEALEQKTPIMYAGQLKR